MEISRPLRAMRRNCLECVGGSAKYAKWCPCDGVHSTYCEFWPYRFGRRPGSVKDQRFVTPVCMPPAEADLDLSDAELTALMTPLPAGRPGQSLHVA